MVEVQFRSLYKELLTQDPYFLVFLELIDNIVHNIVRDLDILKEWTNTSTLKCHPALQYLGSAQSSECAESQILLPYHHCTENFSASFNPSHLKSPDVVLFQDACALREVCLYLVSCLDNSCFKAQMCQNLLSILFTCILIKGPFPQR